MPFGAYRINSIARRLAAGRNWDIYDGSADGSAVIVHDDTSAADGNQRHRVSMFDDTYGVVSYDIAGQTTNGYWRSFSIDGTTITVGSENSWASALSGSHTTFQARMQTSSDKIIHLHGQTDPGDGQFKVAYIVFTLSGSTVSASTQKYVSWPGRTISFQQHGAIFELDRDNNLFVFEAQNGVAIFEWDDSTDTISVLDDATYSSLGTFFGNVALFYNKVDNNNWIFAGAGSTAFVTQGYNFNTSTNTISQNSGTNTTIVSFTGLTSTSRAYVNSEFGINGAFIFAVGSSSTTSAKYYPIKHTTSSVSVGSAVDYNPSLSNSYLRTETGWWLDSSTFISVSGWGTGTAGQENVLLAFPIKYDFDTNVITIDTTYGSRIDTTETYLFQGCKTFRIDDNRIIVAFTDFGVDQLGDLLLKVLQAPLA